MDKELRLQILRASVRDRTFLKAVWRDITAKDFPELEERIVARVATKFWEKYEEPVGALLRSEAETLADAQGLGAEPKKKLKALLDLLQGTKLEQVSVKALSDRVKQLKTQAFYDGAVDDIISLQEKGELTSEALAGIVEKAHRELIRGQLTSREYFAEIEKRIERRRLDVGNKFPRLLIDGLDSRIRVIGRGMTGMVLAPYAGGKGIALIHIAVAYALQGLNVLHISLEDPKTEVEDRLDACLSGLPMDRLGELPNKLRKRLLKVQEEMRGRIKLVDGVEGGWTMSAVERLWEQEAADGFQADAIIVDYDDEIECELKFKGDNARRYEFAEIYRRLRKLAAKTDTIVWTAAQGTRGSEGKKVITGKEIAEDISKARKVFFAVSIGDDGKRENMKHLYVLRHRLDKSRFGIDICTNFDSAIFYDREATLEMLREKQRLTEDD
jgi:hypothetical protein